MADKLEVVVADPDTTYTGHMAEYVRESEWGRRLILKQLSREELLRDYVGSRAAHLYLVHPSFDIRALTGGCRVRLCETAGEAADDSSGLPGVHKYQPLHRLFGRLLELYRSGAGGGVRPSGTDRSEATVCSVFSAAGGTGKTTVAVHLARAFAARGSLCLYWNMELVPGFVFPQEADAELAARLVYDLRSGSERIGERLRGLIGREAVSGADYFPGFRHMRESLEMSRDDARRLVGAIRALNRYDAIVLDLEATAHERVLGALESSDAIVWLVNEDDESAARSARLLEELGQWGEAGALPDRDRIRFVLNKHAGELPAGQASAAKSGLAIRDKLPYVSRWKRMHGSDGRVAEPLFAESVARLADALRPPKGGEAVVGRFDSASAARADS
ncbi:hypothetical protein [Paenibacillus flagellatus]|uniref:hypothetical protein n=1 Tax=Paenibacillus flagellatus TaxID=2211139 RepID=UPI001FE4AE2A|nr:hypothetical protein [Paenibacillus flagellatus]